MKLNLSAVWHAVLVFLAAFLGQLALLPDSATKAAIIAAIPGAVSYAWLQLTGYNQPPKNLTGGGS
jgi:hypothetical protein